MWPFLLEVVSVLILLKAMLQRLHTSLCGSNGGEDFAVVSTLLELFSLCRDGAELVLEAAGSASTIKSRHHVELLFGDGGVSKSHE